jgi:hypothetical protein
MIIQRPETSWKPQEQIAQPGFFQGETMPEIVIEQILGSKREPRGKADFIRSSFRDRAI